MELHFWYDIACPYAYLASTQVEALARDTGADLVWRPVLLGGVLRAVGAPMDLASTRAQPRVRLELLDVHRQAERLGVPLKHHPKHPVRTVGAMRLLTACERAVRPALTHALYKAYWVDNLDLSDVDVLAGIARWHGVNPAVVDDPAVKQTLFDHTAEVVRRGAFGVPAFTVGDELFWGTDRIPFVRQALGGERVAPATYDGKGGKLVFFYDFASPFSYLASTQIERIAAETGASVEWAPFLLGALFREIGTPMVPIDAMSPAKRAWSMRDLDRWAAWWGVPFRYNSHFPLRTVTALRVALLEPRATQALYRAAWVEDRDLSQDEVVREVLDEAELDGWELVERAADPDVKERLRAQTARAQRVGACGAPTFLVGNDLLFWGQDRLQWVADALGGWRPAFGG